MYIPLIKGKPTLKSIKKNSCHIHTTYNTQGKVNINISIRKINGGYAIKPPLWDYFNMRVYYFSKFLSVHNYGRYSPDDKCTYVCSMYTYTHVLIFLFSSFSFRLCARIHNTMNTHTIINVITCVVRSIFLDRINIVNNSTCINRTRIHKRFDDVIYISLEMAFYVSSSNA